MPERMARQDAETEIDFGEDGTDRPAADLGCDSGSVAGAASDMDGRRTRAGRYVKYINEIG